MSDGVPDAETSPTAPETRAAAYARVVCEGLGASLPATCLPGVAASLEVLLRHVRIVLDAPAPPDDPAELFRS